MGDFCCIIESMNEKVEKWLDDTRMASLGIVMASREWRFWAVFVPVLAIFGTLLSLLSGGLGAINLFFASDFGGKMQIIGDGFLGFLGKDRAVLDFLQNLAIALLQSLLIALIVVVYKKRKQSNLERKKNEKKQKQDEAGVISNAGIAAGLALLGSGCPTCGTTLITPIIASVFSTSGYAVAGAVSGIITVLAILLILWSLRRVGLEAYAIIIDEKWRKKRQKTEENEIR